MNKTKAQLINELTQKIFDKIYTLEDILKGDTIEMMKECRNIAIKEITINGYKNSIKKY